ncbi:hypothetical protein NPIL_413341 [Nephila pilipes]|uniref:Uncharacterized protein n=1 Tax=Nephila pilipes TaxID=299642 RepID=A0A8X6UH52_NEPPI|nr:hypothetical protein NPIL_413341 [Nephila pilipes]
MEFITLPDEKQNTTLSVSRDSQKETEVSDSCHIMPLDRSFSHQSPGRSKTLRTSQRGHPRKKYGQVFIVMDCFETSPSAQGALAGPNKTAWKNAMKEEHDTLIKENEWTLVPRSKYKNRF